MDKRKHQHHAAIRARAERALGDLYHNATPHYPSLDDDESERFQSWFEDAAGFEIDYLRSGGAHGKDYRKTLEHPANAGRYKSERARNYYVQREMRQMAEERARCNALDSCEHPTNALWECITDYGELYQYGRGGRTLAPDDLIKHRGSGFTIREDAHEDMPIRDVVRLVQVLESFNRYVNDWCNSVPEQWREYIEEERAQERAEKLAAWRKALKEARERRHWERRDVPTI